MVQLQHLIHQNYAHLGSNPQKEAFSTDGVLDKQQIEQVLAVLRKIPLEERKHVRKLWLNKARLRAKALHNAQIYFQAIKADNAYYRFESLAHYGKSLKNHIEKHCPNYDFAHPKIREVLNNMIRYFYGHSGGYDLNKGIILYGHPGCGKSFLFDTIFKLNPTRPLIVHNAVQIAYEYQQFGSKVFDTYRHNPERNPNTFGCRQRYLVIDDLGVESTQKHYGSEANVIQTLLELRYAAKALTFATTNLAMPEIAKTYGDRVASRFGEMFTFVDMSGLPDYRYQKSKITP